MYFPQRTWIKTQPVRLVPRALSRGLGACDPAIFDLSTCGRDPLFGCQTTDGASVPCPVDSSVTVSASVGRDWSKYLAWGLGALAGLVVLRSGRR